jgi:hypothetical protein
VKNDEIHLYRLDEIEHTPMKWLIQGWWPHPSYGMLAGPEKALKSWLVAAMAVSVATGWPLFGELPVRTTGGVVVFCGEGSASFFKRRLQHVAMGMGFTRGAIENFDIRVADRARPVHSLAFETAYEKALSPKPALVVIDPLYAFHGADVNASNVHDASQVLTRLSEPAVEAGSSLIVANHFNKAGANRLELGSITQAGSREWSDSWLLLGHRSPPDLDEQRFQLEVVQGTRHGFGSHWDLDVDLGAQNLETMVHRGTAQFSLQRHNAANTQAGVVLAVQEALRAHPFEMNKTALKKHVGGKGERVVEALNSLIESGAAVSRKVGRNQMWSLADPSQSSCSQPGNIPEREQAGGGETGGTCSPVPLLRGNNNPWW